MSDTIVNNNNIQTCSNQHLALLGLPVQDRVTKFKGVVTSINFDLYGCIQALVTPYANKEGNIPDSRWLDVTRLKILKIKPVMDLPNFVAGYVAEGKKGAADKPLP